MQTTLAIIKPDAVAAKATGPILARIEEEGFEIVSMRKIRLGRDQAEGFYAVHRERPFFADLTAFMTSGPVVVLALRGERAITRWRDVMGATDSTQAAEGTLRNLHGTDIEKNAVHGSDAPETAATETTFFFPGIDLI